MSATTEKRFAALLSADPDTLARVDAVLFNKAPTATPEIVPPMSIAEAARMLGKSPSTIFRWLNTGAIKATRIQGGNRMIPFSEVTRIAGT